MKDITARLQELHKKEKRLVHWLTKAEHWLTALLNIEKDSGELTIVYPHSELPISLGIQNDFIACFEELVKNKQAELKEIKGLVKK